MMTLILIFVYLAAVLLIGTMSHRFSRGTSEDFFVASRSIGPVFLFLTLFGTNMTAFAILGGSGEAYHKGIGVFALMPSASALVIPTVFFFIGTRVWSLGKRFGYVTQIQYFRERWGSDILGLMLFVVLVLLLIPYLLIGILGGGVTLSQLTKGQIPQWVGGAVVVGITFAYVCYGGMRGTTWANVFQTVIFMVTGGVTLFVIVRSMGGLSAAMGKVAAAHPDLLVRGHHFEPVQLLTYTLVPLSVGMFPHLFIHWLTAKRADTFRLALRFYPVCIALVWIPSVLLGVLGSVDFDLKGPEANTVLIRMIDKYAPGILAGLLCAGVYSAVMNSLDSQALAVSSMLTHDIVRHYGFQDRMSERQQVYFGRVFVFVILAGTFLLSLVTNRSIYRIGEWCFSGYAALFPIIVSALFWKRSTKYGAMASTITVVVLWVFLFIQGGNNPEYTIGGTGVMPVAVMLGGSAAAMILVSLLTQPPERTVLEKFFPTGTPS